MGGESYVFSSSEQA